ncbi:hypothetical protein [Loigolactobacillus jiayinensis]|uniref:Uncharacterized protein n=1 Tax=Loigolactobacillus jiayinensis TaxID=2486016 RepID=A0ABW1RIP0_9LACO|nr:hypothetical protein [Loigolactobacillus jiayinensis]
MTSTALSIYNNLGQRLQLRPNIRYTLIVKNGYILALRAGEKQLRLPNLVVA